MKFKTCTYEFKVFKNGEMIRSRYEVHGIRETTKDKRLVEATVKATKQLIKDGIDFDRLECSGGYSSSVSI